MHNNMTQSSKPKVIFSDSTIYLSSFLATKIVSDSHPHVLLVWSGVATHRPKITSIRTLISKFRKMCFEKINIKQLTGQSQIILNKIFKNIENIKY